MSKIVAPDVPQWLLNWINMVDYTAITDKQELSIRQKLESGKTVQIMSALTSIYNLPLKPQEHIDYYNNLAQQ